MMDIPEVLERVDQLRQLNAPYRPERARIRSIMNGGAEGLKALLGPKAVEQLQTVDFPVVHLLDSGLTRLAQRLGRAPDLKVEPRQDRESDREKDRAQKRQRIAQSYDHNSRLELDLPQVARWLPGYGFAVWVVTERAEGPYRYPHAELRDPYDCYPGAWGPNQQPEELAVARSVDPKKLGQKYPGFKTRYEGASNRVVTPNSMWEQTGNGVALVEYYDKSGTYLVVPDYQQVLDFVPNPLGSPRFVIAKRFSFDRLSSQYAHVLGLMSMMAKFNVLAMIVGEDSAFRETNVYGEIESGQYERGRFATNYFTPGTRVEKPTVDQAFQVFQQLDRLERQLRVGANYSQIEDAQSPTAWATGQGIDRLMAGGDANIGEYQTSLRYALESLDSKRLEWDEVMYGNQRKPLLLSIGGESVSETYTPAGDIAGDYRTQRIYGVMAGWDEPAKIVTGLQLLQGRIIDVETLRENLHGMDNSPKIAARVRRDETEQHLIDTLKLRASPSPENPQGDPTATLALVEIYENPDKMSEILRKFFTPQEPQLGQEEQQFLGQQQQNPLAALLGGGGGSPPPVSTVLSRLEGSGATEGGVQTVGRL